MISKTMIAVWGNKPKKVLIAGCMSILALFLLESCKKNFLDVEPPESEITADLMFADDMSATSAMAGLYLDLYADGSFAGGNPAAIGIVSLAGLSADELHNNGLSHEFVEFEVNNIDPANSKILILWASLYKTIYQCNAILEGLDRSAGVTPAVKDQFRGEALFVRAFCHFYLLNCFGDVPLVLTTDYKINAHVGRTSRDIVYNQIKTDLLEAESLMTENYVTTGRVRPNRFTASALLSRVYLYLNDWQLAENMASKVISNTALYRLPANLNSVFLSTSPEAIWQLKPQDGDSYTQEGYYFGTSQGPQFNVLNDTILDEFEDNDKRKTDWITSTSSGGITLYFPFKYKRQFISSQELNEYSMVLRLAEQYLIRAEARAQQNKLSLAIADVDVIRDRAGLTLLQDSIPGISKEDLLLAIEQERRLEFLAEWGHRWFDLKRWDRANIVLAPLKPGWTSNDQLYPLPEKELRNNSKLAPQNPGY